MSQFWHNLCCRECDPGGECEECPELGKIRVTWTGSITYEASCCEDPNDDYPCRPIAFCNLAEYGPTTIGPVDFILTPITPPFGNSGCFWRGEECFTVTGTPCNTCSDPDVDCQQPDFGPLFVTVRMDLYCVGDNWVAFLTISYRRDNCGDAIVFAPQQTVTAAQPQPGQSCNECPVFECDEEWQPTSSNNPWAVWGGGPDNCNRGSWNWGYVNAPYDFYVALATWDPGTFIWRVNC